MRSSKILAIKFTCMVNVAILSLSALTIGCIPVDNVNCQTDEDCDDGVFCNGAEYCDPSAGCLPGPGPCSSELYCDETEARCDECRDNDDCDDGLFCNGNETCSSNGNCSSTRSPCDEGITCNEEQDICGECVSYSDCDDGDPCTMNLCLNAECVTTARDCGEGAVCVPETNTCQLLDGTDPCMTQCYSVPADCTTIGIKDFPDFETMLYAWTEFPSCDETTGSWLVGGICDEGTRFVFVSDSLHQLVRFFDSDTGQFIGQRFQSDAMETQCVGLTYWPYWLDCHNPTATEVECGPHISVGDYIELPTQEDWAGRW